jgi:predicted HTH domain antitoxin
MKKSSEVISVRLSKERTKVIEEIAKAERVDKSTIIDRALEHYAKEWKLQRAVELYREGSVTLSRATEIAEISIWEMIDVLRKRKVSLQYDLEDLEEDLKRLGCG